MRKTLTFCFLILICLLVLFLIGFSSTSRQNSESIQSEGKTEGYVVDLNKNTNKILVVWDIDEKDISIKPVRDLLKEARPNAIWLTIQEKSTFSELKIGQKVAVWTNVIQDSYPGQADAHKIEIISK